jgi:hypothetical protein
MRTGLRPEDLGEDSAERMVSSYQPGVVIGIEADSVRVWDYADDA